MDIIQLREQLHAIINHADTRKLKAIYTILEKEINPVTPAWPKEWLLEIDQRSKDLDSGKVASMSLDEVLKETESHLAL